MGWSQVCSFAFTASTNTALASWSESGFGFSLYDGSNVLQVNAANDRVQLSSDGGGQYQITGTGIPTGGDSVRVDFIAEALSYTAPAPAMRVTGTGGSYNSYEIAPIESDDEISLYRFDNNSPTLLDYESGGGASFDPDDPVYMWVRGAGARVMIEADWGASNTLTYTDTSASRKLTGVITIGMGGYSGDGAYFDDLSVSAWDNGEFVDADGNDDHNVSSIACQLTNVAAGDLVVVIVTWEDANRTVTVGDGTSSLTGRTKRNWNGQEYSQCFYILESVATGTVTYTAQLGSSTAYPSIIAVAIRPPTDGTFAVGAENGNGGTSSSVTSGTITTQDAVSICFGHYGEYGGATVSNRQIGGVAVDDYYDIGQDNVDFCVGWRFLSTQMTNGQWTNSLSWSGDGWGASINEFYLSTGGSTFQDDVEDGAKSGETFASLLLKPAAASDGAAASDAWVPTWIKAPAKCWVRFSGSDG